MRYASKLFLALCLSLGLGAAVARAQIESDATIEANVPHPFVVRDTTLPAGRYVISVPDKADPNVLRIRSSDGRTAVFFDTENTEPRQVPAKTELIFDKVGDTYFLSKIFVAGDEAGGQLPKSRMEKRLEGQGLKAEEHSVAAYVRSLKKLAKKL